MTDRYFPNLICLFLSLLNSLSGFGAVSCMNIVAVEQHLATIWVETYEQNSFKVGVVLMIALVGYFLNIFEFRF